MAAQFHGPGQDLGQGLALGDADLALDDIDAGDEFGDRVLHLHARVDFDEVELAVLIHQELHRAGVGVSGMRDGVAQDRRRSRRAAHR